MSISGETLHHISYIVCLSPFSVSVHYDGLNVHIVSQFCYRLPRSTKGSENCWVKAISAWHTYENSQSGADKDGLNCWLSPFSDNVPLCSITSLFLLLHSHQIIDASVF